jgi:hypothetical protein
MNAAFMQFQRHGWDIHAVWPGAREALQQRGWGYHANTVLVVLVVLM